MKLRNGKLSSGIELLHPATRDITEHNASSPLIQSPAEVRNAIFGYLIGGQLIHVYGNKPVDAEQDFHAADPELFELPDKTHGWFGRFSQVGSRHHDCQEKFSLAILNTCRQIYHEVKGVVYFANTFSFRHPRALPVFMSSLLKSSTNPRFAIRSLHLDIQLREESDHDEWNKAIGIIPKHLPNVQRLYINLDLDIADLDYLIIHYSAIMRSTFRLLGELYQLRVLPLKVVVVNVADEDWAVTERGEEWFSNLEDECRWTMGQKQEYATELREVLLKTKQSKVHHMCRKQVR